MSDGSPNDPSRKPMPWEPGGRPTPDPSDPTVAWTGPGTTEPTGSPPDPAVPTSPPGPPPEAPPPAGAPPVAPGLISAAPVGWTGQDIGGPPPPQSPWMPAPDPASAAGGAPPPTVGWASPAATDGARPVPGAPGLVFAGTGARFVAYIIDSLLLAIVASIVAGAFGYGTGTVVERGAGEFSFDYTASSAVFSIPYVLLSLVYAVYFWTGGRRATPGQRIFNFQVANAFDGRDLTVSQAVRRWFFLGSALGLLALTPQLEAASSSIGLLWGIVLLVTTATSPTKQGLHDRLANSAVVRPAGQTSSGLVTACLVVIIMLIALAVISIIALVFLGGQMSDILEDIGRSI